MAEDDDGLDPARITRLLEHKVGADGRTVRDQAPPELVELVVRKRERRKEALKKAKKEERRLEAQQKTRAIEADEEEETDGVEEEEEGAGEDSGHVSRLLGWATARAGDMWDGLQGADTTLAEERVAKHMQRKSRATAAPAMRALAEEEEGEEEEGNEAGPSTMTMATAVEEEVAWWQKDAHWQSLGCDLPRSTESTSSQAHPLLRPQPQPQRQLHPHPQPQPQAEARALLRCELPRDLPEVPGKSAFLAHHVLIVDNSGSMRTADVRSAAAGVGGVGGVGASRLLTRSEAVQGVLLHQFLLTQLASGVTANERISLIKLEGGDAQAPSPPPPSPPPSPSPLSSPPPSPQPPSSPPPSPPPLYPSPLPPPSTFTASALSPPADAFRALPPRPRRERPDGSCTR